MRSESLSNLSQHIVRTYGNTARNVVSAYRVGGERAAAAVDQGVAQAVDRTAARVNPQWRQGVVSAAQAVSGFYVRRIQLTSEGVEVAINRVQTLAEVGVQQVSANADRIEKATGSRALSRLAQAALPAAQAVEEVGVKLEARSALLLQRIGGQVATGTRSRKSATAPKRVNRSGAKATTKKLATEKTVAKSTAAKPSAKRATPKTATNSKAGTAPTTAARRSRKAVAAA